MDFALPVSESIVSERTPLERSDDARASAHCEDWQSHEAGERASAGPGRIAEGSVECSSRFSEAPAAKKSSHEEVEVLTGPEFGAAVAREFGLIAEYQNRMREGYWPPAKDDVSD